MCAKLLQLGPAFCDAMDCSPPGSSVEFSRQEYWSKQFAIFSSRGSSQPRDRTCVLWAPALQADSLPLGHQGSPRILEWVVIPFSRGSSGPRDWIQASHIAERFFTIRATWEQRYYLTMWTLDLTKWISLSKKYEQTWWEQELQMGFCDLSLEEHDLSNSP